MSDIHNRIDAFVKVGDFLRQFDQSGFHPEPHVSGNELFAAKFMQAIATAEIHNNWFTPENIYFAIKGWSDLLTPEKLNQWMSAYTVTDKHTLRVAIIMAGNIPLVGFHDFLCVLISGHQVVVKQSSTDKHLLPLIADYLKFVAPYFKDKIVFTEGKLESFDAVIATGSDNTSRYFEYYFGNKPHIIRRNRNSAAVLTGNETKEQLTALGEDIFRYYGLGCRSVSKLFVPKGYNFDDFFGAIYPYAPILNDKKYENNYDYNKAVYLMSLFPLLENGFLMLKEDTAYASPIATVFYEYYDSPKQLKEQIENDRQKIQCVVSEGFFDDEVAFGQTQQPQLWDYADGVDTISFLLEI